MSADGPFRRKDGEAEDQEDQEVTYEETDGWGILESPRDRYLVDKTQVEVPPLDDSALSEFVIPEDIVPRGRAGAGGRNPTLYYPGTDPEEGDEHVDDSQVLEEFTPPPEPYSAGAEDFTIEQSSPAELGRVSPRVTLGGPFGHREQPSYEPGEFAPDERTPDAEAPPTFEEERPTGGAGRLAPSGRTPFVEEAPRAPEASLWPEEGSEAAAHSPLASSQSGPTLGGPALARGARSSRPASYGAESLTAEEQSAESRTSQALPAIDPLPLEGPLPEGDSTWLTSYQIFKAVTQKLARLGDWRKLAATTGHALVRAPYATRTTRTAMLLDLARIYRDRLHDETRAEQAFAVLAQEDPSNDEALDYLITRYEERGNWEPVYSLYLAAVEATWDPHERLAWTRQAAGLALERLGDESLAIKAWENLWRLGDAVEEATRELSRLYRKAGHWAAMANFLQQQADRLEGAPKLVVLRELAEAKLSGMQDPDGASKILEQIVELRPQDPIATLQLAHVYAQRKDWVALERLGQQAASDRVPAAAALDLQHLVADALWQAGRLEQAVVAYDRILLREPANYDGNRRKQEFLTKAGRYEELLALLVAEAKSTEAPAERAKLLSRAASLAEEKLHDLPRAVALWEERITFDPEHLLAFEALARLYDAMGDAAGMARALEGQLRLTKESRRRIEILHRLGSHYAARLRKDEQAEACWKEILSLDSSDQQAREELIELHRRRGDFEALNSALLRQIWLATDHERAEKLCRLAAENLDSNFRDAERSIEAWLRVLDFAPRDLPAFQALKRHLAQLGQHRELIATLEREIRATPSEETKIECSLQAARLWERERDHRAAAACYERILCWDPVNPEALEGLFRIYGEADQLGKALGALEHASALIDDTSRRIELLRGCLALLPEDDHFSRFSLLRRILFLSGGDQAALDELRRATELANDVKVLWPEFTAVLTQLASVEPSVSARVKLYRELAWICEEKLSNPTRAYLALQGILLSPEHQQEVLEELTRLAKKTERHEELFVVLDRLTTPEFPIEQRRAVIRQRALLCEQRLSSPLRAFYELRRLLELDPSDWSPLEDLERLAEEANLWRQLDAVLAGLGDRTSHPGERMELLARRERIAREKLRSRKTAFDLLIRRYRLDPDSAELLQKLTEDAATLDAWDWLLPIIEAKQLSIADGKAARERVAIAQLYEEKLQDSEHAFVLYASAFATDPQGLDLAEKLEQLAVQTGRCEILANTLREAAAISPDQQQTINLLRQTARLYEQNLRKPAKAIEVHVRLLRLREEEMRSLEVMIDWHRSRGEWRDLRDRLNQWIRMAPEQESRVPKLLEVAQLAEGVLNEPETALETYSRIVELDAEHETARAGLKGLVVSLAEPSMRISWLRMEARTADEARQRELQLEIARIQETALEDVEGAIQTLRDLVGETGPDGPGFNELIRLLRQTKQWRELFLLLLAAGMSLADHAAALEMLDEATAVFHEQLSTTDSTQAERLYRAILGRRPDDMGVRVRLARILRHESRFEELGALLTENLQHLSEPLAQIATLYELARLQALSLHQLDAAKGSFERILAASPAEEGALLGLAWIAMQANDLEGYIELRQKQAALLPPAEAALVLCYLAEFCDEHEQLTQRMIPFYREARRVDPNNGPAMEALKGIGRRLKNLRPAAALLPFDGERELCAAERAKRLKALGDQALANDLSLALEWYRRAVAADPDNHEHWAALASTHERLSDVRAAFRARLGWLHACERETPMRPEQLLHEAERVCAVANAAKAADRQEDYRHWIRRAYDLVPSHAAAALATAQTMIEVNDIDGAHALLHTILAAQHEHELNKEQRVWAYFSRGTTLRHVGKLDEAAADFREALRLNPLHADALIALGEIHAATNRFAAALEHEIRALTAIEDLRARARLYYRLGVLWEDGMHALDEGGACYELALAGGALAGDVNERDLLHRSLRHLQRTGRLDQSLAVVDSLLPTAQDPDELATLWLVRGEIFAARTGQEDQAIEAFDMALSYDPARQAARDGLTLVLERRGDWYQLLQVLEATCDVAGPEQQSLALRRMADICSLQLGDQERAERYLRQSVEIYPTREALEYLEQIYTLESGRFEERRAVLGHLVRFGPPWFERCLELSKLLLAEEKRWAWCLLSPLLGVSQVDPDIKAVVQAMRKEYERPPVLCVRGEQAVRLRHPAMDLRLTEVLAELGQYLHPFGLSKLEEAGDGGAMAISESTNMGRIFAAAAEVAGLAGCTLHRTQTLPEAVQVVNAEPHPMVVIRTEIIQQLVHAEVGFFFAYALELAQPGYRVMTALSPEQRAWVVPALWLALGWPVDSPAAPVQQLAEQIRGATPEGLRQQWAEALQGWANESPARLGARWWKAVCHTARRCGLVAGADLRQVFRVMSRIDGDVPRPRVVARIDELDEYIAGSDALQDLVAFAASPAFGAILHEAQTVAET